LILGPIDQLLVEIQADQKLKNKLLVMRSNAQKLRKLINQLLDLSKIESGLYPVKASKGNLNSFIHEISKPERTLTVVENGGLTTLTSTTASASAVI
jgi:signal transduction histidine kinase